MDNNNIYANVTPTPVQDQNQGSQATDGQTVYQQSVYQQPTDQQQTSQQTVYQQPVYQQAIYQQPVYTSNPGEVKCPGKEITGMVLGINSLAWSIFGLFFGWIPLYGMIFGIVYGIIGIGCGIATNIIHNKVLEQATVITNKIRNGKKLATAGIIVGAIAIGLSIIIGIVCIVAGVGAISKYGSSYSRYF